MSNNSSIVTHSKFAIRQINLGRSETASALLMRNANGHAQQTQHNNNRLDVNNKSDNDLFIYLITEPRSNHGKVFGLPRRNYITYNYKKGRARSCILVNSKINSQLLEQFTNNDVVTIMIQGPPPYKSIIISSIYSDITKTIDPLIQEVITFCKNSKLPLILSGDTNSHSSLWGLETNGRGHQFEELIFTNDLMVMNEGREWTFTSHLGNSIIDVTLVNQEARGLVTNWMVDKDDSLSDHRYIKYNVNFKVETIERLHRNLKKADWSKFPGIMDAIGDHPPLTTIRSTMDIDMEAQNITEVLKKALNTLCPLKKAIGRSPKSWWNDDIGKKRKVLRRLHNKVTRLEALYGKSIRVEGLWKLYRSGKRELNRIIQKAKRDSWKNYCSEMTSYKQISLLGKKKENVKLGSILWNGKMTESSEETLGALMDVHIPKSSPPQDDEPIEQFIYNDEDDLISLQTVRDSLKSFAKYKTGGPDGIPPVALHHLSNSMYVRITRLYNSVVNSSYSPKIWRESEIIFIPKPDKDSYINPKAFRPITLANVLLKGLEKIMTWHNKAFTEIERLPNQFGFCSGSSTETAISKLVDRIESGIFRGNYVLTVFFDVENAFTNMRFEDIYNAFQDLGVHPKFNNFYRYYLRNRTVSSSIGGTEWRVHPTVGGGQGGVATPEAWNSSFQPGLELTLEYGNPVKTFGYADDINNSNIGKVLSIMYDQMQFEINNLVKWTSSRGLTLSKSKTKAVLFTRKRKSNIDHPTLEIDGEIIEHVDSFKYLGVILDSKLNFNEHVDFVTKKAKKVLMATKNAIGGNWGLSPRMARWAYTAIARPIMTYAAYVWSHRISFCKRRQLEKVQRLGLLLMTGAYPSSPTATLEIITDITPIHLHLKEIALNTRLRVINHNSYKISWDGLNTSPKLSEVVGHIRYWNDVSKDIVSENYPRDNEIIINSWDPPKIFPLEEIDPGETDVYFTDAAVDRNFNSGAGWVRVKQGEITSSDSIQLGKSTSNKGELLAIQAATSDALLNKLTEIIIVSDSMNALRQISSDTKISGLAKTCRDMLKTLNFTLAWVSSKTRNHWNVLAELFAKQGQTIITEICEPYYPLGRMEEANLNKKYIRGLWEAHWRSKDLRQSKLFIDKPTVYIHHYIRVRSKSFVRKVTQILTGHSFKLNYHRYVLGLTDDPDCTLCLEDDESGFHLMNECPAMATWRDSHFTKRNMAKGPMFTIIRNLAKLLDTEQLKGILEE